MIMHDKEQVSDIGPFGLLFLYELVYMLAKLTSTVSQIDHAVIEIKFCHLEAWKFLIELVIGILMSR